MAYKVIILYQLYMPSYFLGTFTEYPDIIFCQFKFQHFRSFKFCVKIQLFWDFGTDLLSRNSCNFIWGTYRKVETNGKESIYFCRSEILMVVCNVLQDNLL